MKLNFNSFKRWIKQLPTNPAAPVTTIIRLSDFIQIFGLNLLIISEPMRYSSYLFFLCALLCFACSAPVAETSSTSTRIVKDDLGRNVQIPTNPTRILSLTPSITELVYTFVDTT